MFRPTLRRTLSVSLLSISCSLLPFASLEAAPRRAPGASWETAHSGVFSWAGWLVSVLGKAGVRIDGNGGKTVINFDLEDDSVDEAGVRIDGNGRKAGVRIDGNG